MEEKMLVGAQKGGCCGRCFSYVVHNGGKIKSLHPVEVPMRNRMQTAQNGTVDVHAIVPGGVIQFVVDMGIRTTGKHDECRYQKELKKRLFFHQGESAGHEIGKCTGYI